MTAKLLEIISICHKFNNNQHQGVEFIFFIIYTHQRKLWAFSLLLLCTSLTSNKVFVPSTVFHWHVLKSKVQTDSPDLHSQFECIKVCPFCVLKLTALAEMVVCVTGSSIEQLFKYHSVFSFEASVKSTFYSYHHPWQTESDLISSKASAPFLLANV